MKQEMLTIAGVDIPPGHSMRLEIPVAKLYTDTDISIPIHVVRAKKPGPNVFVSAAVHGDELNGTEIMLVLLFSLSIGMITGVVITILTNSTSFLVLIGFVLTVVMTLVSARLLRYVKRQRPEGYYHQWLMVKTSTWFGGTSIITQSGPFDYYRHSDHHRGENR